MLRKLALSVLLFPIVQSVSAEVFYRNDFSGSVSDQPGKMEILSGSLDFQFQSETGDRLFLQDNSEGFSIKPASDIIDGKKHSTVYVSFTFRSLNQGNKGKYGGLILYKDDKEVFGLGNDFDSDIFSFWESDGKGMQMSDTRKQVDNAIHKIVLRIDYHDDGPESLAIGLDPFANRSEVRQPSGIWSRHHTELAFDEIRIRCGHENCAYEFDEVVIGTNWQDVNPVDDHPGEYISNLLKNAASAAESEMLSSNIARFRPAGLNQADVPVSPAFVKALNPVGPIAAGWQLKPIFGQKQGRKFAYFAIDPETDLYATGEVTGSLIRNGHKIVLDNLDNPLYGKADQLYQTHPWVIGLRPDGSAFGVYFDSTWLAELDLRSGILYSVTENAPAFPVMVLEAKSPQELMTMLADLIGTISMPPRWSLGYQQCRWSYYPDARAREIADTFRAKQIPCDVIWFDIHYMDEYRIFSFDKNRFPDPSDTNAYLHSLGFKGVWMIDPGVKYEEGYSVFDAGTAIDAWVKTAEGKPFKGPVWPGDCAFPDFTIPQVRDWWAGLYKDFMAHGIDGVWNDMNEPAVFVDSKTMPADNVHRGGEELPAGTHAQYHNIYGMLMAKASQQGIMAANPDKRPFVLTRANYIGGQRYAATWTGDNASTWEHLRWSIPMSINFGLSGQPFNGPDIGGFGDNATPDLWAHWIAVGAFYPFSRGHSSLGTIDHEPWAFGEETETAARVALERRYRLMPYLYTAFRNAHETGLPVMCPAYFADVTDMDLRMEEQAFMLGSDLYIVPKWAQNVKYPAGNWPLVSLTGEDSAKDKYQCDVHVRPGAIVPLGPVVQSTEQIAAVQSLSLMVVLDAQGKAQGTVYDDAGDGYGYQEGEYCLTSFTAEKTDGYIVVKCSRQQGDLAQQKRIADITVVDGNGIWHGAGDVCHEKGVQIIRK